MKKSTVLKKAIEAVAVTYEGEELLEILRVLMNDLELAEWTEAKEAERNEQHS